MDNATDPLPAVLLPYVLPRNPNNPNSTTSMFQALYQDTNPQRHDSVAAQVFTNITDNLNAAMNHTNLFAFLHESYQIWSLTHPNITKPSDADLDSATAAAMVFFDPTDADQGQIYEMRFSSRLKSLLQTERPVYPELCKATEERMDRCRARALAEKRNPVLRKLWYTIQKRYRTSQSLCIDGVSALANYQMEACQLAMPFPVNGTTYREEMICMQLMQCFLDAEQRRVLNVSQAGVPSLPQNMDPLQKQARATLDTPLEVAMAPILAEYMSEFLSGTTREVTISIGLTALEVVLLSLNIFLEILFLSAAMSAWLVPLTAALLVIIVLPGLLLPSLVDSAHRAQALDPMPLGKSSSHSRRVGVSRVSVRHTASALH